MQTLYERCHHKVLDLVDDSIGAHIAVEYPEDVLPAGIVSQYVNSTL